VKLGLGAVATTPQYIDIQLLNKDCDLLAAEFKLSDVVIDSVVSNVAGFNPLIRWNTATGHVVILDTAETLIPKQLVPLDAFRVYYSALTSNTICISSIEETMNGNYERTLNAIINNCITLFGIDAVYNSTRVIVQPNPSSGVFSISSDLLAGKKVDLTVTDATGRTIKLQKDAFISGMATLDISDFPDGVYLIRLDSENQIYTRRIVKM
jgi:hypothetical protein